MTVSYAITATAQKITAPLTGGTVLTNSSTGGTVYLLSNPSAAASLALIGNATALAALADGLIEANSVLAIPGSVTTFAAACATSGTALLGVRFGTNLVIST